MSINSPSVVRSQYATAANLSTRISIHDKYSVNRQGFGPWIVSHYPIEPGFRVLELGCGTGSMWRGQEELIAKCAELVLSDFSAGMLEAAKEAVSGPNVHHMVIDIQDIPFPAGSFDLVIANMMLYHVPDLPRALAEVRRVLKDEGCFVCATYGEHGITDYLAELLADYGVRDTTSKSFTLQNGAATLEAVFAHAERRDYPDALAVTEPEDLVDYIYSLASMTALSSVPRAQVLAALRARMCGGVLTVPKEYGLFLARGYALTLVEPTREQLLEYYRDFRYDPDLFMDLSRLPETPPDPEAMAERFLSKAATDRVDFLLLLGHAPIGEVSLKHICGGECELSIHLQNDAVKNRGFGTRAEILALGHAFHTLDLHTVRADAVLKNTRSQHVLEKVGFELLGQEGILRRYRMTRTRFDSLYA